MTDAPQRPDSALPGPRPAAWRDVFEQALIVGLLLASVRAGFFAVKDGYLAAGLPGHAARSIARHVFGDGSLCLAAALALAALNRRPGHATRLLVGAAAAALAYAFLTFRWPARPFYAPATGGARGLLAHGVAGLAALVAVALIAAVQLPARLRRGLAATSLLGFAGAAAVLLLARLLPAARADSGRPNLILISLDTLRADHLGCYGYGRPTSPELDRFAARALRFTRAFTPQPWTLTAHMSMLTGLYPSVHDLEKDRSLPAAVDTLPELLHAAGYTTLGVVDQVVFLDPRFGFARGFDLYHRLPDAAATKRDHVVELLDDAGEAPFFLFLHFYDAHSDRRRLPDQAAPADLEAFAGRFDDRAWCDDAGRFASAYLRSLLDRREALEGEDLEHLTALYDAGIRSLDRELGLLFEELERRGLFESSVILVTSDHGEELFEHGRPLHSQCYDECVSVPFLLYTPRGARGETHELASLVDILPTFLELAGLPPTENQGRSLAALARDAGATLPEAREVVLLEDQGGQLGLHSGTWCLVPRGKRLHLFDLVSDPEQSSDLEGATHAETGLPDYRPILEREAAKLRSLRERVGPAPSRAAPAGSEAEALRALGYADG